MQTEGLTQRQDRDSHQAAAIKNYEAAVRYIQKQNYGKAKEILEKLVETAPVEVADRARVHLRFCEQKLQPPIPTFKGAEEYYVAGVSELNARRLDQAIEYLTKADKLAPGQEATQYALAAAYALLGDADAALDRLKASIAMRPQNRIQARHDGDFQSLATDPRFVELTNPQEGMAARAGS